ADEVVASVPCPNPAAFGVRAKRQIPTVEQDVVRSEIKKELFALAALTDNRQPGQALLIADPLGFQRLAHVKFIPMRHVKAFVDLEKSHTLTDKKSHGRILQMVKRQAGPSGRWQRPLTFERAFATGRKLGRPSARLESGRFGKRGRQRPYDRCGRLSLA